MTAEAGEQVPIYDLVGVGFGPSNLALAIALAEHNAGTGEPVTAHFLERQPRFGWHRGMLIDNATMQVSFLKDLVTLRNPTSEFSFLSYLQRPGGWSTSSTTRTSSRCGSSSTTTSSGRRRRSTTWSPTAPRSSR